MVDAQGGNGHHTLMVDFDTILIDPPDPEQVIQPADYFPGPGPVELEIGSGKGTFLLRRAKEHPEIRLVGIEWANKYCRYAADRMARWGLSNVRMMRTDAKNYVMHHLAPECLDALHVYHPDPWPKKRHFKRRLIQPDFVQAACRVLKPNARWALQTDHPGYFEWMKVVFAGAEGLERVEFNDPSFGIVDNQVQTNFEIKYLREGREVYQLAFVKR